VLYIVLYCEELSFDPVLKHKFPKDIIARRLISSLGKSFLFAKFTNLLINDS